MRAVKIIVALALFVAAASTPACTCSNSGRRGNNPDAGDGGIIIGTISVDPADVTLDLTSGGMPQTASFTVIFHGPQKDVDVTSMSTFNLVDATLGVMNANVFTTGTDHGGTSTLIANYAAPSGTLTGQAVIHVKVHGSFPGPNCANCPPFPPDTAPACTAGAAATVVYPPDGVLLPPNLNQIDIQYTSGTGDTLFELDFKNPATDVRVTTKCDPVSDTRGVAVAGGCKFRLDGMIWDFIVKSNKGGDPVVVTIRATTDGTCASPSTNNSKMSVAEQDVAGGIYYWKSKITTMGTGGDIWRKSFGDTMPEEKITPDVLPGNFTAIPCWGCHALSRDGQRMSINADDSDSDDEYSDTSSGVFDVGNKKFITNIGYAMGNVAGFQSFNADHTIMIGSDGDGFGMRTAGGFGGTTGANVFYLWKGTDGTDFVPPSITVGTAMQRPTMPDWSVDGKTIAFVMPTLVGWDQGFGSRRGDDNHVYGGSIWTIPVTNGSMFGTPVEIVKSNGDNNYYPGISPDGTFIAYDNVGKQATTNGNLDGCANGFCPNDSFSNPKARVQIVSTAGGVGNNPIDLELANGSPKATPLDVSNSWPRWSPFLQTYKGGKLLWLTFSSTRDYGIMVRNHVMVGGMAQIQCYPPDSAENPNGGHGDLFPGNCQQPQIYMSAINLSTTETTNGGDPSYPAFWLPFQDISTHNHSAQWTSTIVNMPPPDGGMCLSGLDDCTTNPNGCCPGLICSVNGKCGVP